MVGIYAIRNKINGKMYIGQTTIMKRRWTIHKSELRGNRSIYNLLQDDWNEFGEESFEFTLMEECLKAELDKKEIYWIGIHGTTSIEFGYNKEAGGRKGCIPWNKGIARSNETKMKLSKAHKGKIASEGTRLKMSKTHRDSFVKARSTSGYKGVSCFKLTDKWRATIVVNRKQISLGYYETKEEAALVYNLSLIHI